MEPAASASGDGKLGFAALLQQEPVSNLREGAPPSYNETVGWNVTGNTEPTLPAVPPYPSHGHQVPYPGAVQTNTALCHS